MIKALTAMLGYLMAFACAASTAVAFAEGGGKLRVPQGYFALQPGDPAVLQSGNRRVISKEQLALPHVAGLTIRARWKWLHPEKDTIDLSFFDEQVKRCHAAGKPYKLLVMTGADCAPEWIGGEWYRKAPLPWSLELAASYGALVKALGEKFADDPLLVGVHVTGPTFPSAEMHPAPGIVQVAGYSDRAMIEAWSRSIDAYAAAFPDTACILSISVRPPANHYLGSVVAAGKKALGERFTLEHNALKASTQPMAPHHLFIAREAKAGTRVGFEMVSAAANSAPRFGSKDVMDGIAVGKAAGGTYFDVYPPDLANLR